MTQPTGVQGITEYDIAEFLAHNPAFFERQAELLATVRISSPHGNRAVSLQERQMEMLRERIKGLESKIVEMIRNGQENVAIAERLHRWTRRLFLTLELSALPVALTEELQQQFMVPQVAVRLWNLSPAASEALAEQPVLHAVSDDLHQFAQSLTTPFCGANHGFEAAGWLSDGQRMESIAMIPLRSGDAAFGLLVLGSPDPTRFSADMGTEFLMRIGDTASAALTRLLKA